MSDLLNIPAGLIYHRDSRVMPRHHGPFMVRMDRIKFGTCEVEHGGWIVGSLASLLSLGYQTAKEFVS